MMDVISNGERFDALTDKGVSRVTVSANKDTDGNDQERSSECGSWIEVTFSVIVRVGDPKARAVA